MRRSSRNAGKTVIYTVDSDSDSPSDDEPTQPPHPAPLVPKIEIKEDNDLLNAPSIPASSISTINHVKIEPDANEANQGIDSKDEEEVEDLESDTMSDIDSDSDAYDDAFGVEDEVQTEELKAFQAERLAAIKEKTNTVKGKGKAVNRDAIEEEMENKLDYPVDEGAGDGIDLNFRSLHDHMHQSSQLNLGTGSSNNCPTFDSSGYMDWNSYNNLLIKREATDELLDTPPPTAKKPRNINSLVQQGGPSTAPALAIPTHLPPAPPFQAPPPLFVPPARLPPPLPFPASIAANPPQQFTPEMQFQLTAISLVPMGQGNKRADRHHSLVAALAKDGWIGEVGSVARYEGVITGSGRWSNATALAQHMLLVHQLFEHTDYPVLDPAAVYGRQDATWLLNRWNNEQKETFAACCKELERKVKLGWNTDTKKIHQRCFCGIRL